MAKTNSNGLQLVSILIGLIIGGLAVYIIYPTLNPTEKSTEVANIVISDSKTHEVDGVLIFIKSEPKNKYEVLDNYTQERVSQILNKIDGITHDGNTNILEKIEGTISELSQNVKFEERTKQYVKSAKSEHSDVQGLVFTGSNLREAKAIKFIQ